MEEELYEINEELDIAELAAQEGLEALYECGAQVLYDHYIRDKSVPFAAQQIVYVLGSTIELYYIRHDTGEPEIWEETPEPSPCIIDPWMRSVVPVKKKFKEPEPDEPSGQSIISVEKSMRSHKSFRSSRSSFKKKTSPTKSTRGFQNNNLITEEIKPIPIPNAPSDSSEDEAENQMREMKERQVKRKKEEKERLKQRKDEEAAKEREYQREAEELKNKMFTYDFGGKIMIVNPIKFENVNAYSTSTMKYAVPEAIVEEMTMKDKKKKKDRTAVSDFGIIKQKKVPVKEQEWVRNATSLSASVFDSINLALGVTIFDGNRSKLPLSSSQSKLKTMSRKEYFGLTAREQAFRSTGDLHIQIAKQESIHSSSAASRQNTIYKLPSIVSVKSQKDLLENIPDNETHAEIEEIPQNSFKRAPTEEIPQISVKETPQIILAKSPAFDKIRKYENIESIKEITSPIDKFNVEILKNKNWGLNPPFKGAKLPAQLPKKNISPRKQWGIYGDKIKKPKDNPFASAEELWESQKNSIKGPRDRRFIERVEHKQRMPPPPFGQSMVDYSTLASTIPDMQEKSNN